MHRTLAFSVALAVCYSTALAGNTLVVDKSGGSAFTEIQPAVNAAQEGDTIFVRIGGGDYAPAVIDGKGLHLVAESTALAVIAGSGAQPIGLQVINLPAGSTVIVTHFLVRGASPTQPALRVDGNQGSVRFEACHFMGKNGTNYGGPSGDAASVANSVDVSFSYGHFFGGAGRSDPGFASYDGGHGGEGMEVRNSTLALYACEIGGGSGGDGVFGGAGGDGLRVVGPQPSFVFAAHDNWFRGGNGGDAIDLFENAPGSGGDGLVHAAGSTVYSLANLFFAGQKGQCLPVQCYGGSPGVPVTGGGQFVQIPGPSRRLDPLGVVLDGNDLPFALHGQPGDQVVLLVSQSPGFSLNLAWNGVHLLSPFVRRMVLGTLPGNFSLPLPESMVAPGKAKRLIVQPVFVGSDGSVTLGNAQNLIVFDSVP